VSDPTDVFNWRRISGRITSSGQPSEAQLGDIQKLGVTTIINLGLHTHEKALPDEAASVAALGMKYVHIPVPFDAPSEAHYETFVAAMKASECEIVHVHCIANMRVSAFLYRYQRDELGLLEDESRAVMDSVWRPGGPWARLIGDEAHADQPHGAAPNPPVS
jgi:protein tyrosine phosphatase (PTP) superfamily phosphohydrolase (DUF442 family)